MRISGFGKEKKTGVEPSDFPNVMWASVTHKVLALVGVSSPGTPDFISKREPLAEMWASLPRRALPALSEINASLNQM